MRFCWLQDHIQLRDFVSINLHDYIEFMKVDEEN